METEYLVASIIIPTRDFRSPASSSSAVGRTEAGVATSAVLGTVAGVGISVEESGVVDGAGMSSGDSVLFPESSVSSEAPALSPASSGVAPSIPSSALAAS